MKKLLWMALVAALVVSAGCAVPGAGRSSAPSIPGGSVQIEDTLYFGMSRKDGVVTAAEWQAFVDEMVTPRFPDGLTVFDAQGQWRRADGVIAREPSKALVIVHDEDPAATRKLEEIITEYKRRFGQESVLFTRRPITARF